MAVSLLLCAAAGKADGSFHIPGAADNRHLDQRELEGSGHA
jgi:hypothetical protein